MTASAVQGVGWGVIPVRYPPPGRFLHNSPFPRRFPVVFRETATTKAPQLALCVLNDRERRIFEARRLADDEPQPARQLARAHELNE
jgi:hypothetical protein